jgi:large subunit ribosomal protein L35
VERKPAARLFSSAATRAVELSFQASSAITRRLAARLKGCRGGDNAQSACSVLEPAERGHCGFAPEEESQMPKLKTKSGAKKRFKVTAGGKVLYAQSGKRHGMIKRTKKTIREHRGTNVLFKTDGDKIKKYFLPNG